MAGKQKALSYKDEMVYRATNGMILPCGVRASAYSLTRDGLPFSYCSFSKNGRWIYCREALFNVPSPYYCGDRSAGLDCCDRCWNELYREEVET